MRHSLLLFVFSLGLSSPALGSPFRLAPLFTDNMVLQQQSYVPFWGTGTPGSRISVHASWKQEAGTMVGSDGRWSLTIPTPRAGGPFEITVRHDDTTEVLRNVLSGEVWLCSGQSNMEMPLEGWSTDTVLNSADEIASAAYPRIRLFTVKRAYAAVPQSECAGTWVECTPRSARAFSAAGYFFGRMLHKTLNVPVGLIHASWGGTAVESWMSGEYLSQLPQYDSLLQKISITADSLKVLQAWLEQFPVVDVSKRDRDTKWQNLPLHDEECALPSFDDDTWHIMDLPTYWERTEVGEFDGVVWFRRGVKIPASWVHRDLVLELGPVDDMDATYVNGVLVGAHETEGAWALPRVYTVPARCVDSTLVNIALRVIDNGGGGGIYGAANQMCMHLPGQEEKVSLAGDWRYLPVADYRGDRLYVFGTKGEKFFGRPRMPYDFSGYSPTALYNGMIAPLSPFRLAGVIWYQGESNAVAPEMYGTLFPLMIMNWRSAFRLPLLPFYYVQIAPYAYDPHTHSEYLRESQFLTLKVKNTGMAVTLDIGNVHNIHPANKQEVGRRLALWALARTYGKAIVYSGPLYRSARYFRDRIELSFEHAWHGLVVTQSVSGNGFVIAGEDRVFKPAEVRVRGDRLIVSRPGLTNPKSVRYAFSNTSQATLFNTEGLPSPSFRTDRWNP
jgi:sialate O-acetylesterase